MGNQTPLFCTEYFQRLPTHNSTNNFMGKQMPLSCAQHFPGSQVIPSCEDLIRTLMGLFYVGAGFWKINTSFLSPRVSCGSVYVASMLYFLPPSLTPTWFVKPLLATGGVVTVVAELFTLRYSNKKQFPTKRFTNEHIKPITLNFLFSRKVP